jgi:hypothetical protein
MSTTRVLSFGQAQTQRGERGGDLVTQLLDVAAFAAHEHDEVIRLCRGPGYADPSRGCPGQWVGRGCGIGITLRGRS